MKAFMQIHIAYRYKFKEEVIMRSATMAFAKQYIETSGYLEFRVYLRNIDSELENEIGTENRWVSQKPMAILGKRRKEYDTSTKVGVRLTDHSIEEILGLRELTIVLKMKTQTIMMRIAQKIGIIVNIEGSSFRSG